MFDDNDTEQEFELTDAEIRKLFIKLHKHIVSAKKMVLEVFENDDDEDDEEDEQKEKILSIKLVYDDSFGFKI
jgi:hypothetical protein